MALQQLEALLAEGAQRVAYWPMPAMASIESVRQRLTELGLPFIVGIAWPSVLWPRAFEPLPPKRYSGRGALP